MKKFLTLLLAAAMTLSLAACGSKTDDNSGNNSQPASALELLNAVWANYSDDDKFPATGGDYDEANMTEDAPGNFSVEDGDALDYSLSFPAADAGKLSDAASLTHMMNANTFTAGAFHVASSSDVDSVVSDLKDNIMNRQWMCGFPQACHPDARRLCHLLLRRGGPRRPVQRKSHRGLCRCCRRLRRGHRLI